MLGDKAEGRPSQSCPGNVRRELLLVVHQSYEHQLVPLNWQAGRHIEWLMNWIEQHADKGELEKWRIRTAIMGDPSPAPAGMLVRWRRFLREIALNA
jgi:hypothetical protein